MEKCQTLLRYIDVYSYFIVISEYYNSDTTFKKSELLKIMKQVADNVIFFCNYKKDYSKFLKIGLVFF